MKPLSTEKQIRLSHDIIAMGFLVGFAYFISQKLMLKGIGGEDLQFWASYKDQPFFTFLFSREYTGTSPLYRLAAWLELTAAGSHVEYLVPFHVLLNGAAASCLYKMGKKISGKWTYGCLCGVLFLAFGMSWGQLFCLLGLQEMLGLWLNIGAVYCLHIYLWEKQEKVWYYHGACWLYFGVCLVSVQYRALILLFYLTLILRRRFQLRKWFWPLRQLLLAILFTLPKGGGQSQGSWQIPGPAGEISGWTAALMWGAGVSLILLLAVFLVRSLRDEDKRDEYLANGAFFLAAVCLFILLDGGTAESGSGLSNAAYGAVLLFLSYIGRVLSAQEEIAVVKKLTGDTAEANFQAQHTMQLVPKKGHIGEIGMGIFLLYVILALPLAWRSRRDFFQSENYQRRLLYHSLAEETIERYGQEWYEKTIYILGPKDASFLGELQDFFRVFAPGQEDVADLQRIETTRDIGLVTSQMVVLWEDEEGNGFQDVTQLVKEEKFKVDYGLYEDGWMDQNCSFSILSGPEGEVSFRFLYPGMLSGGEETKIYVDGQLDQQLSVEENIYSARIQAKPYQLLDIQIESSFFVQEAMEQRGEAPLTALVEITTK